MSTEVVMPQMGESIAEGTITKRLKQVGDRVERDEPQFEISTDKVDEEIPSLAVRKLTEIKFREGDTVEVNTVVAILDGAGNGGGGAAAGGAAATRGAATAETSEATSAETPGIEPPAKETSAQQTEAAPAQREEQESQEAIAEAAPSSEVETPEPEKPPTSGAKAAPPAMPSQPATTTPTAPPPARKDDGNGSATIEDLRRSKSSPLVRKIAQEHGIDITRLEGTGMSGRVTKNDILSFIESGAPAPGTQTMAAKPGEGDRVEPMSVMRKKIAEHMVLSRRTSAHVTTVYEIDMTKVARLREEHRDSFLARTGTKLTYMPFVFQAVTNAIRKFPMFNAQVSDDKIIYKRDINLGMAVALDWGLIVPVSKRADDLSIAGLARAANDLAERARTKQLKPDEVGGGTFTITNPGVFGGLFGTPIIKDR